MSTWYKSKSDDAKLRTSTVELALAERPSGLTLRSLTERLGPRFDMGDVLSVLRRRPDLFVEWDGRWLSTAVSLQQSPRRLDWQFDVDSPPPVWRRFREPQKAAAGWKTMRGRLHETAFDPSTAHIRLTVQDGEHEGLRLHIDHTVVSDRAAWIVWTVDANVHFMTVLERVGFFLWDPRDPRAMLDVTHRIPRPAERHGLSILATWCLRTPLELADAVAWLLVDTLGILNPATAVLEVERIQVPPAEARAFPIARRVWERRSRGETLAFCNKCGNPLSDPNSVALGYGPECAARLGLESVRALARGRDGVLLIGAVPLPTVRQRMLKEASETGAGRTP